MGYGSEFFVLSKKKKKERKKKRIKKISAGKILGSDNMSLYLM